MKLTKIELMCDNCGDYFADSVTSESIRIVRKSAKRDGWLCKKNNKDYCEECAYRIKRNI